MPAALDSLRLLAVAVSVSDRGGNVAKTRYLKPEQYRDAVGEDGLLRIRSSARLLALIPRIDSLKELPPLKLSPAHLY